LIALGELFVVPGESKKGKLSALFIKREDFEKKMREAVEGERDPENLVQLGWRLLQDRLNELACICLEKAMGLQKRPKEALLGLGIAHLEAGRASKAEHFLLEYLDQNPDSATAHLNLFKAYLADGDMDLAWEEIQTAVRLEPNGLEGLKQIYYFFLQSDRKEEGLDWLDHLAGEHTALPGPLLVKAWALTEEQRWPEARQTLEEALRRSPHNEAILLTLTSEMGQRGEQEDLIHLLRGEPAPLPLTLTINLALAYGQTGRKVEGRKVLRAFLKRPGLTPLDKERVKALLQEFDKES
jgi:tetratricopeptide (TPR) repeat protein